MQKKYEIPYYSLVIQFSLLSKILEREEDIGQAQKLWEALHTDRPTTPISAYK
jgi:hypothetical protein